MSVFLGNIFFMCVCICDEPEFIEDRHAFVKVDLYDRLYTFFFMVYFGVLGWVLGGYLSGWKR